MGFGYLLKDTWDTNIIADNFHVPSINIDTPKPHPNNSDQTPTSCTRVCVCVCVCLGVSHAFSAKARR